MTDDYIVCAALRHKRTRRVVCSVRHFDMICHGILKQIDDGEWRDADQGFVNQNGKFLSREQALEIAQSNGQFTDVPRAGKLFSEDLY